MNDYQTEDECPGDSEESDSEKEDARENNNNKAETAVNTRRQCAKTRTTLAENQLENNERGELVCLTCLKQFSNVQNLRRHLRLHLQRDSNIAELDSDGCDQADKVGEAEDVSTVWSLDTVLEIALTHQPRAKVRMEEKVEK